MQISKTSLKYIWLKLNHFQVEECQGDQTEPGEKQVQKIFFRENSLRVFSSVFAGFWKLSLQQQRGQPTRIDFLPTGAGSFSISSVFEKNHPGRWWIVFYLFNIWKKSYWTVLDRFLFVLVFGQNQKWCCSCE